MRSATKASEQPQGSPGAAQHPQAGVCEWGKPRAPCKSPDKSPGAVPSRHKGPQLVNGDINPNSGIIFFSCQGWGDIKGRGKDNVRNSTGLALPTSPAGVLKGKSLCGHSELPWGHSSSTRRARTRTIHGFLTPRLCIQMGNPGGSRGHPRGCDPEHTELQEGLGWPRPALPSTPHQPLPDLPGHGSPGRDWNHSFKLWKNPQSCHLLTRLREKPPYPKKPRSKGTGCPPTTPGLGHPPAAFPGAQLCFPKHTGKRSSSFPTHESPSPSIDQELLKIAPDNDLRLRCWLPGTAGESRGLCSITSSHGFDSGLGYEMTAPDTLRGLPSGNLGEEQDNLKLPTAPQSPAPLGDGVRKSQGTFLSPLCARVPRNPSSEIKPNPTQPSPSSSRGSLQAPTCPAGSLWDLRLSKHLRLLHKSNPSLSALRRKGGSWREGGVGRAHLGFPHPGPGGHSQFSPGGFIPMLPITSLKT